MAKNLIWGPILAHVAQIWCPKFLFCGFYLHWILDIVASNCMQFQGKRMIQPQENGKKPNFGPGLGPLGPNSGCHFFLKKDLNSPVSRYRG